MFRNIIRGSRRPRKPHRRLGLEALDVRIVPALDQVFDPAAYTGAYLSGGVAYFNTNQEIGQTFTVGVTGILTQVDLYIYKWEGTIGDLVLDIRGTRPDEAPTSPAGHQLITTSVPPASVPGLPGNYAAFFAFDLTPYNLYVQAGEKLSAIIHVAPATGADASYQWEGRVENQYPAGKFYGRVIGNHDWINQNPNWDMGFRTYVEPAAAQPPVATLPSGPTNYAENDPPVVFAPTATVADPDTPKFDGGTVTVSLTANGTSNDRLGIRNQGTAAGQIGVSGSSVNYGGVNIGTFTGGTNGSTPLVVTLNAAASQTAVEALVRNLTFLTVADAPVTDARTVQVVLTDGDGTTSDPATTTVTVTATNDIPAVTTNLGLTVAEGATGTIGQSRLMTSDPDNTPTQLTYTVTTAPTYGTLRLNGSPTTTFTQADINANLVTYQNDGNGTTPDSFSFTVTDGALTTATATFNITVTNVNDPPVLTTNTGLTVTQGQSAAITSARLAAADPDNTPAQVRYTLTAVPAHGTVRRNGSPVTTFTQAEIDAGQITYQHGGIGTAADGFTFTVGDGTLSTSPATFAITVQPPLPVVTVSGYDPAAGVVTFTGDGSTNLDDHLELFPVAIGGGLYVLGHNLADPNLASNTDLDPNTAGVQRLILSTANPPVITVDLKAGNDTLGVERSFGFSALVEYDGGTGRDAFVLRSGGLGVPVVTWKLTGANTGAVTVPVVDGPTPDEPVVDFTGTEDLTGTDGNDPFVFLPGGTIGRIDGGGGLNTLDYSALSTSVEVFLPAGAASHTTAVAGFRVVRGGAGDDVLVGDSGGVVLSGGAGNDILLGGGADDVLTGGAGNDLLVGGGGNDQVVETMPSALLITLTNTSLNGGADTGVDQLSGIEGASLVGGIGNDVIRATAFTLGPVTLSGSAGNDKLYGGTQGDLLIGDNGKDRLFGGAGNDRLNGGNGNDVLNGGPGHDTVEAGSLVDTALVLTTGRLRGNDPFGAGTDTLISINRAVLDLSFATAGVTLNAAGFGPGPVTLVGGSGNDMLIGTNRAGDSLAGGAGSDTLQSGKGADTVNGGADTDTHLDVRGSTLGDTVIDIP